MIPRGWRYAWQHGADPWIVRAREWADAAVSARPPVTVSVPEDGGPVLAYGGLPDGLTHVLPFLEQRRGPAAARRVTRRTSWTGLADGRAAPDADILAVGCLRRRVPDPVPEHVLLLPFRVTLAVPTGGGPERVLRGISRKARQQHVREVRSRARTLRVATGDADFEHFYEGMHRPTMRRRHGDAARSESKETARACLFRRGALFYLCEDGRPVAGMLCRRERAALVVRLAGVAGGDEELYRSGTYMSLYILVLQWASEHGVARVDLSGCEPFLSKGIFQFKRKMHPEVALPANHFGGKRLHLRVRRDGPAVRAFLAANPMLTLAPDGALEAAYFHDDDHPPRTDLRWEAPGITGHRLIHLDGFLDGLPATPLTLHGGA
ncbi:GNAT family N-acetyltransferase [Actinomadura litoris]|uniref:GNAT family N-acetyltransferase n=1 Tax=Actinomadura litoris TaxID=2678616 RepID=UPI001FA7792A|nr:GNAT family N-acetyltransferase [Actinomadura litoris]